MGGYKHIKTGISGSEGSDRAPHHHWVILMLNAFILNFVAFIGRLNQLSIILSSLLMVLLSVGGELVQIK